MKDSVYYRQAKLLLRILPITLRYPIFALKGGTAINFFIRDMPRLSVDIDLTYTPVCEPQQTHGGIIPHYQDIKKVFENEFDGMPFAKVSLQELEEARDTLVRKIHKGLTDKEKQLIVSVKKGEPKWDLLGLRDVNLLPAVQWKLLNISRMDRAKLKAAISKLEKSLSL